MIVAYYSNTGESRRIAEYLGKKLGWETVDILKTHIREYDRMILVFPVYCQGIPKRVEKFLGSVKIQNLIPIATYGKMSYGDVLRQMQDKFPHKIVSAAYVPTKHTYSDEERFSEFEKLGEIIENIYGDEEIKIPRSKKSFWADMLSEERSRMGVKIIRTDRCTSCGVCTENCPENAVINGITGKNCIRCFRYVENCPGKALEYRLIYPMKKYLSKVRCSDIVIYTASGIVYKKI